MHAEVMNAGLSVCPYENRGGMSGSFMSRRAEMRTKIHRGATVGKCDSCIRAIMPLFNDSFAILNLLTHFTVVTGHHIDVG